MKEVIGLERGQPDYRIMIVEDQRENWLLLQRLLQTAGFQVRVAEDGAKQSKVSYVAPAFHLDGFASSGDERTGSSETHS